MQISSKKKHPRMLFQRYRESWLCLLQRSLQRKVPKLKHDRHECRQALQHNSQMHLNTVVEFLKIMLCRSAFQTPSRNHSRHKMQSPEVHKIPVLGIIRKKQNTNEIQAIKTAFAVSILPRNVVMATPLTLAKASACAPSNLSLGEAKQSV